MLPSLPSQQFGSMPAAPETPPSKIARTLRTLEDSASLSQNVQTSFSPAAQETPHTPPKVRLGIHKLLDKLASKKSTTVGVVPGVNPEYIVASTVLKGGYTGTRYKFQGFVLHCDPGSRIATRDVKNEVFRKGTLCKRANKFSMLHFSIQQDLC